jgi:hypothetical protein
MSGKRILAGTVAGVLSGLGASIVIFQGGSLAFRVETMASLVIGAAVLGGLLGAVAHRTVLRRLLSLVVILYGLAVTFGGIVPAAVGQGDCDYEAITPTTSEIGGTTYEEGEFVCLDGTSRQTPWKLDVSDADFFVVFVSPGIAGDGQVELRVTMVAPVPLDAVDDELVWRGDVSELFGGRLIEIDYDPAGVVSFRADGFASPKVPAIGVYELTLSGAANATAWVQLITNPLTNPIGLGGTGAFLVGTLGMLFAGRAPRAPGGPPEGGGPEEPVHAPLDGPIKIPAEGPHADYVDSHVVDSEGRPVSPNEPLIAGREYRLELNVTPGVSTEDRAADGKAHETTIHALPHADGVDIAPVVMVGVAGTPFQFSIPLTPRRATKRAEIDFDIVANGHLLQSERIRADVVSNAEEVSPREGAQTTRTIFTSSDFSSEDLGEREPRAFNLILRLDSLGAVDVRVIQNSEVTFFDTTLTLAALAKVTGRIRGRLVEMLDSSRNGVPGYVKSIDGSLEQLNAWLPYLAEAGRSLYRSLLPEELQAQNQQLYIEDDATIQINQQSAGLGSATVPWSLLYDRKLQLLDTTRVCDRYAGHGGDDCPYLDDATVVCPWGFWGYRYVIEQPPSWVGDGIPPPAVHQLVNNRPLAVSFNVEESFDLWQDHLGFLGKHGEIEVMTAKNEVDLTRVWADNRTRFDLVYFYCHHRHDTGEGTYWLEMGGSRITPTDLDALLGAGAWPQHPIVMLNGCATGDYGYDTYESLIDEFRRAGAGGVIGTETGVREFTAESYARDLYVKVFGGDQVGRAMLDLRRSFMVERNSPLAFLYTLFAIADVALVTPVGPVEPTAASPV